MPPPPRGVKKILTSSSPVKLVGSGCFKGFQLVRQGIAVGNKFKGLTKRLADKIFSEGSSMPSVATRGNEKRTGWRGKGGGRARGSAVDKQLSRAVNTGKIMPQKGQFSLTKLALIALHEHGLTPVTAQRGVCSEASKLATAADIICYEACGSRLVVVELKCGHSGSKTAAATIQGQACKMRSVLRNAADNTLNRHFAQLAVTRELFAAEATTMTRLRDIGVGGDVGAVLLYVSEESVDLYTLPTWWFQHAPQIVKALK